MITDFDDQPMKMSPLAVNCSRERSHTAAMSKPPLGLSGSMTTVPLKSWLLRGRLTIMRVVNGIPVQPEVAAGGDGGTIRIPAGGDAERLPTPEKKNSSMTYPRGTGSWTSKPSMANPKLSGVEGI